MAHEESPRRDLAGIGPDPRMAGRLYRMGDVSGFHIVDGEPDIRGWDVRTLAGEQIGEVDDLLIDPDRGEVVMIDVDLRDSDQHVNVPIRGVQLDRHRNCVVVDSGDIRLARESLSGVRKHERDPDSRIEDRAGGPPRNVRYGATRDDSTTEEVIERRPVIEEVVVRRRVVDDSGDRPTDI